jgi:hypothetical protein
MRQIFCEIQLDISEKMSLETAGQKAFAAILSARGAADQRGPAKLGDST